MRVTEQKTLQNGSFIGATLTLVAFFAFIFAFFISFFPRPAEKKVQVDGDTIDWTGRKSHEMAGLIGSGRWW